MPHTFIITYYQPDEPLSLAMVDAAIITFEGRHYPVRVWARRPGSWAVTFGELSDDAQYTTFQGALTAAHLNAYLYATDLIEAAMQRIGCGS